MLFKSKEDQRRAGILRVGELAMTKFQTAGQCDPAGTELRSALGDAKDHPKSSEKVERVREIMIAVPELEELLRKEFPEGLRPPPFRGKRRHYH